ncbi:MAG: NlpC/P60 family protein [Armatimonadota bacterium]|nr:NlpC/P60 family protein [Armatimonadota bacterium]
MNLLYRRMMHYAFPFVLLFTFGLSIPALTCPGNTLPQYQIQASEITVEPASAVCVGTTVTFSIVASDTDYDMELEADVMDTVTYNWNNEGPGSSPSYSKTYTTAGTYTVTCEVNDDGDDDPTNSDSPVTRTASVTVVEITGINGPSILRVGQTAIFTPITNPGTPNLAVGWTGGGTPPTGTGNTFQTKWDNPGVYTLRVSATVGGTCYAEKQVTVVKVTIAYPYDGNKLLGEMGGERETLQFLIDFSAKVEPASAASSVSSVTFTYAKGGSSNTAPGSRRGSENIWDYEDFDLRTRYTTAQARYSLKATATIGGVSCESSPIYFCIRKGDQIKKVAEDWLHYPYQWGSKGPGRCSHSEIKGLPVDGYYDHGPYYNDHPAGDGHHPTCFDCSGYAWKCLSYCGVSLPDGTAASQYSSFPSVSTPHVGDLLFRINGDGNICHVMISIGGSAYYNAPRTGEWSIYGSGSYVYASGPSGDGWCMDANCSH